MPCRCYFVTVTSKLSDKPLPVLKATVALPVFFLALIEKTAVPSSFVFRLAGLTEKSFLPAESTFAVIFSPTTLQLSSPVTVTVIAFFIFSFFLRVNEKGDTLISSAVHSEGVGVASGVGVVIVERLSPLACIGVELFLVVPFPN